MAVAHIAISPPARHVASSPRRLSVPTPKLAKSCVLLLAGLGLMAGFAVTGHVAAAAATAAAGPELTQLLRAMAAMKAVFAAGALAATVWRLGSPVTWQHLAAYAAACAAMSAGPGLIWDMAHVKAGAVLLHAGLFASIVLLWRDPATSGRLSALIAARRKGLLF